MDERFRLKKHRQKSFWKGLRSARPPTNHAVPLPSSSVLFFLMPRAEREREREEGFCRKKRRDREWADFSGPTNK